MKGAELAVVANPSRIINVSIEYDFKLAFRHYVRKIFCAFIHFEWSAFHSKLISIINLSDWFSNSSIGHSYGSLQCILSTYIYVSKSVLCRFEFLPHMNPLSSDQKNRKKLYFTQSLIENKSLLCAHYTGIWDRLHRRNYNRKSEKKMFINLFVFIELSWLIISRMCCTFLDRNQMVVSFTYLWVHITFFVSSNEFSLNHHQSF